MFTAEINKLDLDEKSHDTRLLKAVLTLRISRITRHSRSGKYFLDDGSPSQDFIQSRDDIEKPQTTSALILLRCKNNYAKFLTLLSNT